MLAVISESGFEITIGRADLASASDLVAGACMTSFFEAEATNSEVFL
jgi:hypothetical protein